MAKQKPRICLFDIECTNLNANFGYVLCVAWKWLGEKKIHLVSITDFDLFDSDCTNDRLVVREAAKEIAKADMWVTWYGQRFDVPYLQTKLLQHGMKPLPPIPHVDGWRIARYKMKLHSNRLASVSDFLGIEEKTPLKGPTWIKAAAGHKHSIKYVERHCKQDVLVLEQAYEALRPLCTTHPNMSLATDRQSCPVCSTGKLIKRGFTIARTRKYQRWQCTDCGAWSKSSQAEPEKRTIS